ncbi:Bifunctional purine biosynthetic protein ADE5,7 [Yamadazyma tenuis]|uniref:Phosphoribosylglycinamide formyltransferase n=1 Tax=Candida tenuis (strain ATCC 10573 / BCRC 21748 / CBS 615 / JCM 9827 / NBRC 10315 / NRRL Y-1498 / VKM Y-70) TaxID=590646 RepID=G3AZ82_CANTC|nr:phosphoribosylglycinamide formyltransferase [Yamadazyma tenuis ATCC 10573]EGV66029.1 phosphoribosylglycinamide formyltransferase [Yamadazyma tenuis ATCC 10573]WEJ95629.1 Bifunctional purine biosynthetic protein ADE5,7 [Yamadazyma tenuis]
MKLITVLISGSGSNLQALIDAQASNSLGNGNITHVISSSASAYGLQRAQAAQIPTTIHQLKTYYKGIPKENTQERTQKRHQFNVDLANLLIYGNIEGNPDAQYTKPHLIVCAGWMLILSPQVLEPLEKAGITIINLHPALPGAFDGTHAIERAWKAGQAGEIAEAGVMIHKVITEVDRGQPVLVKRLEVGKPQETLEEYEKRVHDLEHIAIVEGTNMVLKEL